MNIFVTKHFFSILLLSIILFVLGEATLTYGMFYNIISFVYVLLSCHIRVQSESTLCNYLTAKKLRLLCVFMVSNTQDCPI